jgi:hypothetical protein
MLAALRRLGVEAALTPEEAAEAAEAAAAAAGEGGGGRDGWCGFPLSGRGDAATSLLLATDPPGAITPQLFATVQLIGVWCAAGRYHQAAAAGGGGGSAKKSKKQSSAAAAAAGGDGGFDPAGNAALLAALVGLCTLNPVGL